MGGIEDKLQYQSNRICTTLRSKSHVETKIIINHVFRDGDFRTNKVKNDGLKNKCMDY